MKIIGLRIEKYIDKSVSGHNCKFTYSDETFEKHIICGVLSDNRKVEIELSRSEDECGSGWTTASWGFIDVREVFNFNGYTFVPIKPLIVEDLIPDKNYDDVVNDVFLVDYNGGDSYYPSGGYTVNMDLFTETLRHKEKRPVWIFKGKSNKGKSFISGKLKDVTVYETDSSKDLPEVIKETVIVLGNKYKFKVKDIKERLFGEVDVCIVKFK